MTTYLTRLALPLLLASVCNAADLAGAKDYPLIKRYEGSEIIQHTHAKYAPYALAMGKALNPAGNQGRKIEKEEPLEGQLTRITYACPPQRTSLEVFRNYQQDLKDKGFTTLFTAEDKALGYYFARRYEGIKGNLLEYNQKGNYYLAAKLQRPEGDVTVALFVCDYEQGNARDVKLQKGQALVQLDIIEAKPMDEKMVTVTAEKMSSSLQDSGHIALYGILFDFNQATLLPASGPTLEQMAKLLKSSPELKLLVVGHTDNVGSLAANQILSEKRAQAVAAALTQQHGISAARLSPMGAGFMAPVASNKSEDGRAKNRRVELVEQ